jgi:Outer membrane lipoprotein-sorting protein
MIFRSGPFRKLHALLPALFFAVAAHAEPDAQAILEAVRVNPVGQNLALSAQLREGSRTTPFKIVVDDAVRYQFSAPEQEFILKLGQDTSTLQERSGGKTAEVKAAKLDDRIRGSGITYEDLALKFLYWKTPKLLGEETVRSLRAWKMELQSGRDSSQYGVARVWIGKDSGAILRIEGYNREGKLIRKFEVISGQKIEGQWMLKQMRIETLDPETKKVINRTYLEVLGKA